MPSGYSIKHLVQFSETDMAGIVHFANYFRWMEMVEHAFFRSLGFSVSMNYEGRHLGWPRVSAACDFFGPLKFEDEVSLCLRVTNVGEKSLAYEVEYLVGDRKVALGRTTSVCCELADGKMKSIAIPQEIRQKLTATNREP